MDLQRAQKSLYGCDMRLRWGRRLSLSDVPAGEVRVGVLGTQVDASLLGSRAEPYLARRSCDDNEGERERVHQTRRI